MRVTPAILTMFLLVSGCGSCQRSEEPSTGGTDTQKSSAGAAAPAAPGKIEVAPAQPLGARPGSETPQQDVGSGAAAPPEADAEPEGNEPSDEGDCIVIADANPDYGPPPLAVEFSAEAECGTGQPTYKWDFGDGSGPSTEANPNHTYTKVGDFTAIVTVTDSKGGTSTDEIDVTVEEEEGEAAPQ